MKISRIYPGIGYNPERLWCAFGFGGMLSVAEDHNIPESLSNEEKIKRFDRWMEELHSKFPTVDALKESIPADQWSACKAFSGLEKDMVFVVDRDEKNREVRARIDHKQPPLSPSLGFELSGNHLGVNLHNCGNSVYAVVMFMHGLYALKCIYDAYGIDAHFMPKITFNPRGDFTFEVPYHEPSVNDERFVRFRRMAERYTRANLPKFKPINFVGPLEGIVNYSELRAKAGIFTGEVPKTGSTHMRTHIAMHLFNIAVMQADDTYRIAEYE